MIAPLSDPKWKRFVTGEIKLNSPKLALSLLEKSIRLSYQADSSPQNIQALVKKAHTFFHTHEIHFLDEIRTIFA